MNSSEGIDIPYRVLGVYHPTRWYASIIGPELCEFTRKLGFKPLICDPMLVKNQRASWHSDPLHANVVRFAHPDWEGTGWHQDGDNTVCSIMDCGIILWANRDPTFIQPSTAVQRGKIVFQPQPFEVVYFRNLDCFHRRPSGLVGKRWLFRQRTK